MAIQSKLVFSDPQHFALGSPLLLTGATFLLLVSFISFLLNRPKKLDLPTVGEPSKDYRQALIEGTAKYPDSPFIIPTSPPLVILPISTINEVRNLPESKASFMKDIRRIFSSKQTGIGTQGPEVFQAVKVDLTRHIASTLDDLQEEIRYGIDKEFGPCSDWTKFRVYSKLTRIVALLSGRVFVGRPLSREEEWINATIMYTFYIQQVRAAINAYPEWARRIVAPFLPELKHLRRFRKRGGELLRPILDEQIKKEGNEKVLLEGEKDEQGSMVGWIMKHMNKDSRYDQDALASNQMALSMAAIHTTSMAATAAIYDLAAYPEYIQPLRDEIEQVIAEDGQDIDGDGFVRLKKSSMPKLWKLDSFLKESQRFTPPQLPSNVRVTTAPLTLSTGHTLPTNTRFGFAAYALHTAPPSSISSPLSPSSSPSFSLAAGAKPLSQFDGNRYYNLRKVQGNENRYQFVTTSSDSLNFGHGNHACPGRFFASNEIKVVLIELLRKWEFRFVGDEKMVSGLEVRPENFFREMTCMPNVEAEMEFRKRKVEI